MGFALWIEEPLAWAQGVHEYRPLGAAVISATDLFRARDFRPGAAARARRAQGYVGLFASLGAVNDYLTRRRSAASRKELRPARAHAPPCL